MPRHLDDRQMASKIGILSLSWATIFNAQKIHARPLLAETVGLGADQSHAKQSKLKRECMLLQPGCSLSQNVAITPKLFEMSELIRQILYLQLISRLQGGKPREWFNEDYARILVESSKSCLMRSHRNPLSEMYAAQLAWMPMQLLARHSWM
jgi:hypothetical protein